jgi:hypothetical protein
MACKAKTSSQTSDQTALRVSGSDLTPTQRKKLLKAAMSQTGFTGFIKHQDKQNKQTPCTFTYGK